MKRILIAATIAGLGLMAGACAEDYGPRRVYALGPGPGWDRHEQWCFNHRPGYDPQSNTWVGPNGEPRVCR